MDVVVINTNESCTTIGSPVTTITCDTSNAITVDTCSIADPCGSITVPDCNCNDLIPGYWTKTGLNIYYDIGNVLIGKQTGSYPLDVDGDINIDTGHVYRINGTQISLDDVTDGSSYERVAANQLSSGIYIDATTTTKGIASFDASAFTVTSGEVSLTSSSNWDAAYTHVTSNGTDHTYIDQDVSTTASPTFVSIEIGASTPFNDTLGNLTLQNVDAIDATTEATIESAIDSLPNLASIGSSTGILKATTGTLSYITDNSSNWNTAYTHVSNNGSDHTYIDQDVTSGSAPVLANTNMTGNISVWTNDSGYITTNQTITLTGDVTGSGTTSISTTIANNSHTHLTANITDLATASTGITKVGTITTGTWNGSAIHGTYIQGSTLTLSNITQITNRSHTNLSDTGSNSHTQIDSHISSTSNPHSTNFINLTDTPSSYTSAAGKFVKVTSAGTSLEFVNGSSDTYQVILSADSDPYNRTMTSGPAGWSVRAGSEDSGGVTRNNAADLIIVHNESREVIDVKVYYIDTSSNFVSLEGSAAYTSKATNTIGNIIELKSFTIEPYVMVLYVTLYA